MKKCVLISEPVTKGHRGVTKRDTLVGMCITAMRRRRDRSTEGLFLFPPFLWVRPEIVLSRLKTWEGF